MNTEDLFRGEILLFDNSNKKDCKKIKFSESVSRPNLYKRFMSEFKKFRFSSHEKQNLSLKERELILGYENISSKIVKKYTEQLLKDIKNIDQPTITISASNFGAYICLAAAYSGKIESDAQIIFDLKSFPVKLFPKKLVKKKPGKKVNINVSINDDCWLIKFDSLTKCPSYLKSQSCPVNINKAA